jgi:hypothetical protein
MVVTLHPLRYVGDKHKPHYWQRNSGYVQNVVGFRRFLAQSSILSTTGQGWNMRFVLTACYPAAGWNPPTTGPMNHGQAQTLLRYRPQELRKLLLAAPGAAGRNIECRVP